MDKTNPLRAVESIEADGFRRARLDQRARRRMLHTTGGVVSNFGDSFFELQRAKGKEIARDNRILHGRRRVGGQPLSDNLAKPKLPRLRIVPEQLEQFGIRRLHLAGFIPRIC